MEKEAKKAVLSFKGDKVILGIVIFLTLISTLMVYSTGGKQVSGHLIHLLACYIGLVFCYTVSYRKMAENFSFLMLLFAIFLLILTLGSRAVRGITLMGRNVQTFYVIGFFVIIFLCNFIGRRYKRDCQLSDPDMTYLGVLLLGFCGAIAVMNMSTAIILFITGLVIFFVGNFKFKHILRLVGIAVAVVAILAFVVIKSENGGKIGRMGTFVNRLEYYFTKDNSSGYGDQMILSRAAIARSGLSPAGPGKGVIKNRLPERDTDYAYASLFEETGLLVGIPVLLSYLVVFYRSWRIAKKSSDPLGALLAFGIGFWFTCQALVHIGVNCELLPTTGQTLPFISSGGMSLLVSGCAMGVLLNISKKNAEEEGKEDLKKIFYRQS